MPNPFNSEAGKQLVQQVASAVKSDRVFITQQRSLVFLCGGPIAKRSRSLRYRFLKFSRNNLKNFHFFLAENIAKDISVYGEERFINLARFETHLSNLADCVIIFPEAIGAFAETGYFSAIKEIKSKTLVANKIEYQVSQSFVNNGPIDIINRGSEFGIVIFLVRNAGEYNFHDIGARLTERIVQRKRERISDEEFRSMPKKQQFFLVYEIVRLFGIINFESIEFILKEGFGRYKKDELKIYISALLSENYIDRTGQFNDYFRTHNRHPHFYEYQGNLFDELRMEIVNFYQTHAQELMEMLP